MKEQFLYTSNSEVYNNSAFIMYSTFILSMLIIALENPFYPMTRYRDVKY